MIIKKINQACKRYVTTKLLGERNESHTGVFLRFRVIYTVYVYVCCMYVGMSSIVYGKTIQKNCMLKRGGGIT